MKATASIATATLLLLIAGCDSPGEAPPSAPEFTNGSAAASTASNAAESIRARQSHYKQIGGAMKTINDELKKDSPSVPAIQKAAATINGFAPQIQGWFPDGSGAEAGLKTEARAEIWSNPAEFQKAAQDFVAAAGTFETIAASGDLARIGTGVKDLGGACKGCHDQFRVKD